MSVRFSPSLRFPSSLTIVPLSEFFCASEIRVRFVASGVVLVASALQPPAFIDANSTADISSTADHASRCCWSESKNSAIVTRADGRSFGSIDSDAFRLSSSLRAFNSARTAH